MIHLIRSALLFLTMTLALSACHAPEDLRSEPEVLSSKAAYTAKSMFGDPEYASLLTLTNRARAVLIVPSMLRAGFIWGARTGNGVLMVRDPNGGGWRVEIFVACVPFGGGGGGGRCTGSGRVPGPAFGADFAWLREVPSAWENSNKNEESLADGCALTEQFS